MAIPAVARPTSAIPQPPSSHGLLRVVSPSQLDEQDRVRLAEATRANARPSLPATDMGSYIRARWQAFRNHRNNTSFNLNERLLRAQRMFAGEYDAGKLAAIKQFGGSEVYSRLVAGKCRAASALLRDVYLGPIRPWDIQEQPDSPVPPAVQQQILELLALEAQTLEADGDPVDQDKLHMRFIDLMHAAKQAAKRNAQSQAKGITDKIEDLLVGGKFYSALAEFLADLPLFPFACIKGPVVRMVPKLTWNNGSPTMETKPQMFWERVSPFNLYWTPGVSHIDAAEIIERRRLTRNDLNDLIGLPGYDQKAVMAALEDYGRGYRDWMDWPDAEQAMNEGRENPNLNESDMIDAIEYHGTVQGSVLLENGFTTKMIPEPEREYSVQSWVVGLHTIKTQLNPSPRQRHPYFVTSYEKIPGTIVGHGLPDVLEDLQEVANATLRSIVNNLSISSGPQVVINDDAVSPGSNTDDLYPWKRWHTQNDPMSTNREPVTFFQPQSNAQELLAVFQAVGIMADEVSAIPRYVSGSGASGGAGRTASGLSMLMDNASKVLQNVVANVDGDVMAGLLSGLYDMLMLTDKTGTLTGEEEIRVRGVNVAVQQETERQKQIEFLRITANPIDGAIIGPMGRARVLRAVAQNLGLPEDVVPDDAEMQRQMDIEKQKAALAAASGVPSVGPDGKPIAPGGAPGNPSQPGGQQGGSQAPSKPSSLSDHAPPLNAVQPQGPVS